MSIESIAGVAPIGAQMGTVPAQLAPAAPGFTAASMSTSLAPPIDPNALATHGLSAARAPGVEDGLFDRLVSSLGEIDAGMQAGARNATELALGQADNLHQVMIDGERTRLQFELAMSMRNRVLEAYQEIMRMQV